MKKVFIFIFAVLASLSSLAQKENTSIEQYCQVIATPKLFSNKVTIELDFGEEKSYWRENRLKTEEGRLKKFNTIIDALNYMGKEGWVFINAYPVHIGSSEQYHFAFRKVFPKSEIGE